MKSRYKFVVIVPIMATMFCVSGCGDNEPDKVALTSIAVTPPKVDLTAGQTLQLTATPVPENADDVKFAWSSDNTSIASVSSIGVVTAVAEGSTVIRVKSGAIEKSVPVNVAKLVIPLTGFTVTPSEVYLTEGATQQLTPTPDPLDATDVNFTYLSDNTASVIVSETGLITGVAAGAATVTVSAGTIHKNIAVTVKRPVIDYEKTTWIVLECPSGWYANSDNPDYVPEKVFDNDPLTAWHSAEVEGYTPQPPHILVIDMKKIRIMSGIKMWNRCDANYSGPRKIRFELSDNQMEWETLLEVGEINPTCTEEVNLPAVAPKSGRYLKITIIEAYYINVWSNIAEITPYY